MLSKYSTQADCYLLHKYYILVLPSIGRYQIGNQMNSKMSVSSMNDVDERRSIAMNDRYAQGI